MTRRYLFILSFYCLFLVVFWVVIDLCHVNFILLVSVQGECLWGKIGGKTNIIHEMIKMESLINEKDYWQQ